MDSAPARGSVPARGAIDQIARFGSVCLLAIWLFLAMKGFVDSAPARGLGKPARGAIAQVVLARYVDPTRLRRRPFSTSPPAR